MSDATQNLPVTWDSGSHSMGTVKDGCAVIREGAFVVRQTADGKYDHGGDKTGVVFAGVALEEGEAGQTLRLRTIGVFGPYAYAPADADEGLIGTPLTLVDDQTVDLASATTNDVVCGALFAVDSASQVRVKIEPATKG